MNNKILKQGLKWTILLSVGCLCFASGTGQRLAVSSYGLPFINSDLIYRKSLRFHPEKEMVPLSGIPGINQDLRYASANNFMHKKLYPENTKNSFLRRPAYLALKNVASDLDSQGISLVVFDAYRPYTVTVKIWIEVKNETYAANPAKGSGHNRGVAVDLTLADSKTHQLLPMPTGFDSFSDSAHQAFMQTDPIRIANRELLKQVMQKHGFIALPSEWWHFSWPHAENFEVLDLPFEDLQNSK